MTQARDTAFQATVLDYYAAHGRHDLAWRQPDKTGFDPYKILVSELMLQQTQVARVIPKYDLFLKQFPTVELLAAAPLGAVLTAWSGLGYNRRAQYLQRAAQAIVADFNGVFPRMAPDLVRLPGVGSNTAGAILAYSFNQPVLFIETNIRSVYIHHFFNDASQVTDKAIMTQLAATLDATNPRQWYWALMDYGSYLKQSTGNAARRSASYSKQSTFAGSQRQLRGQVIRILSQKSLTLQQLQSQLTDERLPVVLETLVNEGLVQKTGQRYQL
ncbi:MAG: A/G-specific adenine glycosylase [Patescibacteria group bacterium]|nr:A/G-specific adenine glycosylase [Patescibacteria group bacterium]